MVYTVNKEKFKKTEVLATMRIYQVSNINACK